MCSMKRDLSLVIGSKVVLIILTVGSNLLKHSTVCVGVIFRDTDTVPLSMSVVCRGPFTIIVKNKKNYHHKNVCVKFVYSTCIVFYHVYT